jgi:hypothetical protein
VVYDESAPASSTTPVTVNNTAGPALIHHVRAPAPARSTSAGAPNRITGPATCTTSAGAARSTLHPTAGRVNPANRSRPHMPSRTTAKERRGGPRLASLPAKTVPATTTPAPEANPLFKEKRLSVRVCTARHRPV